MFRFLTAGESHGESLVVVLEGIPAGLQVSSERINGELARRQKGAGRGKRMEIETDRVGILTGMRSGRTLGSPITLSIRNRDWENWKEVMAPEGGTAEGRAVTSPRPGHADLAGGIKYGHKDFRNVLERASARETATRVAAGAVAKMLLERFGVSIVSQVLFIGESRHSGVALTRPQQQGAIDASPVRTLDKEAEEEMLSCIDSAARKGETLGGVFEIRAFEVPVGLGSYAQWDRRLDADLARAIMSIPAIKGVQIGSGFTGASQPGSQVHDAIYHDRIKGFYRETNRAGGIEGGVSNGETVVISAAMKPIPTLMSPLPSVHFLTKGRTEAAVERSDVTAVPAAAVIGEAMTAVVLARHMCEKFGGDCMEEMERNYRGYMDYVKNL
jgi:chorismate synthase